MRIVWSLTGPRDSTQQVIGFYSNSFKPFEFFKIMPFGLVPHKVWLPIEQSLAKA